MPSNNLLTHDGYPAVKTSDGKHMTEYSITVTDPRMNGGKPTNIPSLWKGKVVDEDTAVNNAIASKKEYRSFDSIDSAVSDSIKKSSAGGANAPEKYAMGGNVQAETDEMLADGGIMQQGDTVDPVSGNDVPPGAMQEEVRDDIDAKLSEGGFVLPADVVRFIGLSTLMKMRDKAKEGLQKMQDIGQMGNAEEVPDAEALHGEESEMDDSSFGSEIDSILSEDSGGGEEREYAIGGYVVPERQALYRNAPMRGFEMVPMSNDLGQTIYIPFINGVAQLNVPSGYKPKTSTAIGEPTQAASTTPEVAAPAAAGVVSDGGGDSSTGAPSSTTVDDVGLAVASTISPTVVGLVGNVLGLMGFPTVGKAVSLSKSLISTQLNQLSYNQAVGYNQSLVATQLGLSPEEAATPEGKAAVAASIDSLSSFNVDTPSATTGSTGTGGAAASAASAAAAAAASVGQSVEAQAAASQAAANATVGGANAAAAAQAGADAANASQAAETGMSTNAQGQTVSSDASIAAQNEANFGASSVGDDSVSADQAAADAAADATDAEEGAAMSANSSAPDGPDGGSGGGDGKIVCTAMNEQYGFGSFRNSVWLKYSESNMTKAHEVGYHTMFLPLVDFAFKQGDGKLNMVTRKILENVARHRSLDLRAEMRGTKRDPVGMVYRSVLEPLCYIVGKLKGY